jgi:hypothetical protein
VRNLSLKKLNEEKRYPNLSENDIIRRNRFYNDRQRQEMRKEEYCAMTKA